jgi:hypothetical protein
MTPSASVKTGRSCSVELVGGISAVPGNHGIRHSAQPTTSMPTAITENAPGERATGPASPPAPPASTVATCTQPLPGAFRIPTLLRSPTARTGIVTDGDKSSSSCVGPSEPGQRLLGGATIGAQAAVCLSPCSTDPPTCMPLPEVRLPDTSLDGESIARLRR